MPWLPIYIQFSNSQCESTASDRVIGRYGIPQAAVGGRVITSAYQYQFCEIKL